MFSKACPISTKRVDTNILRFSGVLLATLALCYLLSSHILFLLPIIGEFIIRVFFEAKYAPAFIIAKKIADILSLKPTLEDAAPKAFAAKLGLGITSLALLFHFINNDFANISLLLLFFCILLEVVFQYCIGCKIYMLKEKLCRS